MPSFAQERLGIIFFDVFAVHGLLFLMPHLGLRLRFGLGYSEGGPALFCTEGEVDNPKTDRL